MNRGRWQSLEDWNCDSVRLQASLPCAQASPNAQKYPAPSAIASWLAIHRAANQQKPYHSVIQLLDLGRFLFGPAIVEVVHNLYES